LDFGDSRWRWVRDEGFEVCDQRFGSLLADGAALAGDVPRICFSMA
jgi:hypothetical protein